MYKDFKRLQLVEQRNSTGREAELNGHIESAIKLYEENVKDGFADPFAYERLMIIYRKLKRYKDEIRVIEKGIKVFSEQHENVLKEALKDRRNKKQLVELSNVFMTKSGLKDKKGNHTHLPEPVNKWMNRKEVAELKLKKELPQKKT